MVVSGGLKEDVCEIKETWSTSGKNSNQPGPDEDKEGMVPRPVPLRQTGPAISLYQAVLGMIYPCWSL
jgi:hypothetical protein